MIHSQQLTVSGVVINEKEESIPNVLISIFSKEKVRIDYMYSDINGKFSFVLDSNDTPVFLKVSSLFYESTEIEVSDFSKPAIFRVKSKVESLEEVVITSNKFSKDTVNLDIKKYNIKDSETIENSLKKIPGISIDKEGRIKFWNTEIEKILIDGDDLASDQYTFISKNLRSEVLEDIQLLKNFEENTVFKKSRKSDKIALNLKIKDGFKNVWFGNVAFGYGKGFKSDHEVKQSTNIGLIKKKIKFLNAQKFSTLGDKSIPLILGENDYERTINPLYNQKIIDVSLPDEVVNFNNAFSDTFLMNTKIKNLVIRSTNFIGIDEQEQELQSITDYFFQDEDSFTEQRNNDNRNVLFFGELEVKNPSLANSYFVNKLKYRVKRNRFSSLSLFDNTAQTFDNSRNSELSFFNLFQYTYRFSNGIILNNELNMGLSNSDENSVINSDDLSALVLNSPVNQVVDRRLHYVNFQTDATFKLAKRLKSRLIFAFKNSREQFDITLRPENNAYRNNATYTRNEFILGKSFVYSYSRKLRAKGGIYTNFYDINDTNKVFLNYNMDVNIRYWGSIDLSFARVQELPENQNFLMNYYLTNNNTFRRGGILFEPLSFSQFKFKLNNKNKKGTFNNEVSFRYKTTSASILNQFSLQDNVNFNDIFLILREGKEYAFGEQLIVLVKSLGFKFETTHSFLNVPLNIDTNELNELYFGTYNFEITSYFNSAFNFNLKFEYNKNSQTFNNTKSTFDSRNVILESNVDISEALTLSLDGGVYELENDFYNVFNIALTYEPKDKKVSYNLRVNNILNEDEFSYQQRSSFLNSVTTIPLVPFYMFASVKYIF
ncbi:hypothetical protein [Kordia sp.]|uniref:hypothetical protein n=1 Tax=Kordia sp. TaxID=1965332 RepID=UPI003B597661